MSVDIRPVKLVYWSSVPLIGGCAGQDEETLFSFIPTKNKWLWIYGPSGCGNTPSLTLDGVILPCSRVLCNLELRGRGCVPRFTAPAQWAAVARKVFAEFHLDWQLCLILNQNPFRQSLLMNLTTAIWSTMLETSTGMHNMGGVMDMPWNNYESPLLCKLHWLPVCFQVQLKMTYKAIHCIVPDYLRDHLSFMCLFRLEVLQVFSIEQYNPIGIQEACLLCHTTWPLEYVP